MAELGDTAQEKEFDMVLLQPCVGQGASCSNGDLEYSASITS